MFCGIFCLLLTWTLIFRNTISAHFCRKPDHPISGNIGSCLLTDLYEMAHVCNICRHTHTHICTRTHTHTCTCTHAHAHTQLTLTRVVANGSCRPKGEKHIRQLPLKKFLSSHVLAKHRPRASHTWQRGVCDVLKRYFTAALKPCFKILKAWDERFRTRWENRSLY